MSCATSALTTASLANCRKSLSSPIMRSRIFTASVVLWVFCSIFGISMLLRILFKLTFPLQRSLNLDQRDRVLFRKAVRKHCHISAVKKIQDAILHMSLLGAQLINSIPQEIHCWSSQLVSELTQQHDPRAAICPRLRILPLEVLQPVEHRGVASLVPKEYDPRARHVILLSLRNIGKLRFASNRYFHRSFAGTRHKSAFLETIKGQSTVSKNVSKVN